MAEETPEVDTLHPRTAAPPERGAQLGGAMKQWDSAAKFELPFNVLLNRPTLNTGP